MKKHLLVYFLFLLLLPSVTEAQRVRARWKAYRYEWSFGIGASNFLGDLGGANQIGTHGLKDLEVTKTRPSFAAGFRYKLNPFLALHSHFTFGAVAGDDKLTTETFRSNRNLNFKTNIYELNLNLEASILSQKEGGIYRLKGVKRSSSFEAALYAFAGIGVFHFNPKGKSPIDGKWYELQPLGTEGQGLSPARKKYNRTQICIPLGIGGRYFFNRRWGFGFEIGIRKTFNDYIDDVSKTYYDNSALAQAHGINGAILADPSGYTTKEGGPLPGATNAGEQRGDPRYKDSYMFAIFSLHYKIRTGRTNFPIF